jgi:NADPH-dependent F420 reductase
MNGQDTTVAIAGGTGALGSALAVQLVRAGATVRIGSRRPAAAEATAATVQSRLEDPDAAVSGHANEDAVRGAGLVFLTVPFTAQAATLRDLATVLEPGQVLVDATVPLAPATGGKPTRTIGVWQGSAAQQARELAPDGVAVVSALHSVSAVTLGETDVPGEQQDVLVMGDDRPAKARVAQLIDAIPGLRAVDGGPLESARIAEQLTALLIGLNIRYKTHAGVRFTDLPEREWD